MTPNAPCNPASMLHGIRRFLAGRCVWTCGRNSNIESGDQGVRCVEGRLIVGTLGYRAGVSGCCRRQGTTGITAAVINTVGYALASYDCLYHPQLFEVSQAVAPRKYIVLVCCMLCVNQILHRRYRFTHKCIYVCAYMYIDLLIYMYSVSMCIGIGAYGYIGTTVNKHICTYVYSFTWGTDIWV